jgi:Tol biopolymer transport system component/DNA-binding winged helix-turn-helix (wHTH) protein
VLRFGPFALDSERGELEKDGRPVRLPPQPTQLLALLVRRAGRVVTREEIQQALWSDETFVDFDQGINFCIKRIREALGDDAETPRFVETVPRRGYRFIASVDSGPHPRTQPMPRWLAIGAAVLAFGLFVAALARRPARSDEVGPAARPFTSYEGRETEPAFSPDGRQIAFTWDGGDDGFSHVYVRLVTGGDPLQLTSAEADDWSPAWSPDGSQIVFLRNVHVQENWAGAYVPLEVLQIPALGGPERLLGRTAVPFRAAWHPDGERLVIGEDRVPQSGLVLLSPLTGETQRLTFPPEDSVLYDRSPAFSPDGSKLAFIRGPRLSMNVGDLYVQDASGGEARQLTVGYGRMADFAWTPDGDALVFSSALAFEWQLFKVDVGTGEVEPLEGTEDAQYPAISGDRLAFSRLVKDLNVWRVSGPSASELTVPEKLIASTRDDHLADYSPDGTRIAFVSDRDGEPAVWIADASGQNERRLAAAAMFGTPRWSPAGDELAYSVLVSPDHVDIFVVNARGGPTRNVTANGSVNMLPSWSPDGRWIYFASLRTARWEIWRVPSGGGDALRISRDGGTLPVAHGDWVYYYWNYKIWRVAPDGGEPSVALDAVRTIGWTLWNENIVYIKDGTTIEIFDPGTGETREVASLGESPELSLSIAVSPDGKQILYNQNDHPGSDIVLVENFRP